MNYFTSIIFFILGLLIFINKELRNNRGLNIDLSQNYEYIIISSVLFIFSIFIFYYTYKSKNNKQTYIEHSICPTCQESYNYIDLKEGLCPDCNIKTVDIKEYYQDKKYEQKS